MWAADQVVGLGLPVLAVPAGALAGEADAAVCLHRQAFLSTSIPCIAMEDVPLSQRTQPRIPGIGAAPCLVTALCAVLAWVRRG
jgi:hypothetical protein